MARVDHELTIARPPEEVFTYLTDPAKLPEWQSGAIEARKETDGPMGVGTTITEVRKFLGRRIESTLEVTEYEPGKRFSLRVVSGPVPGEARQTLAPVDGGTRLAVELEAEPGGFFKLAEPVVVRAAKRMFESDYGNLKDLLEAAESW